MTSAPGPARRRQRTASAILDEVKTHGPTTRGDLERLTGFSRSAVASAVADLIEQGIVVPESVERSRGDRGRPVTLLRAARPDGHVLGIDFGHTHVRVALGNTRGEVVAERTAALDVDGRAAEAMQLAADLAAALVGEHDLTMSAVRSVAAGIPGPLDRRRDVVSSPTILASWVGHTPADELARLFGTPVHVENDADMGAIGEHRFGGGRTRSTLLYIKASHGIGAGIIIGGQPYRGVVGIAGEIGHTILPGTTAGCRCGKQGCLEASVSVPRIREQLQHTHLAGPTESAISLEQVAADPVGERILVDAGRAVGRVVADGCNWFNPEAVIVGGELGVAGDSFARGVRESIDRYAQPATAAAVKVEPARLGPLAEVYGALAVAIDRVEAR
ncbi:MAG: ROK family transcriptional regulator [Nocardioides sp.]